MVTCSIGIMAYNEEANIGQLLDALIRQELTTCGIKEIYVVASGCTDRTEEIVRNYMDVDNRITILVQEERKGKSSAINLFLTKASADIFILESGDTIPEKDTIEKLVTPFFNEKVGMTGGRPIPVNAENTFIGFTVNLLWNLHHRISLETPKLGELIAFRNIVSHIPADSAVDEASIEAIITNFGLKLCYVGDAHVYNKGPENIKDYLRQRRRVAAGHMHLCENQGYTVSTTSGGKIVKHLLNSMKWQFKTVIWTIGAVVLEIIGRGLGYYDLHIRKKNPFIWDIATSTKKVERDN